jgi:hypothetical protein
MVTAPARRWRGKPTLNPPSYRSASDPLLHVQSQTTGHQASQARHRRSAAAAKYKPDQVQLLLVAEAPPSALDRYFYFEDVRDQDSLFRHVVRALLNIGPSRAEKARQLKHLAERGVFLIDLKPDPKAPDEELELYVDDLVIRAEALNPRHVITIKANVCDLTQRPLRAAGLNVADQRVPFPGSGQQQRFLTALQSAATSFGWPECA